MAKIKEQSTDTYDDEINNPVTAEITVNDNLRDKNIRYTHLIHKILLVLIILNISIDMYSYIYSVSFYLNICMLIYILIYTQVIVYSKVRFEFSFSNNLILDIIDVRFGIFNDLVYYLIVPILYIEQLINKLRFAWKH